MALLPYLGDPAAEALYQEFHLDEPWDSEHNRKLIERMPAIYENPNFAQPGKTVYQGLVGADMIFGEDEGLRLRKIIDGTSNTVMLVEVDPDRAVEWTRPADLQVDAERPLAGLGNLRPQVFNALFVDGSVHAISKDIDPELLRRLFTYRGLEEVTLPAE